MDAKEEKSWIYQKPIFVDKELEERIRAAEEALGFKLFYWQCLYISDGQFRSFGATTAEVLRDLLLCPDTDPFDVRKFPSKRQDWEYRSELIRIYRILKNAGVTVRKVLLPEDDDICMSHTVKNIIPSMISGIAEAGKMVGVDQKDILKEIQRVIQRRLEEIGELED